MPRIAPDSIASASRELGFSRRERKQLEEASRFGSETNRLRQEERRSRESQERRAEQRRIVEQVIEEVTGEQIGNAGMKNSEMVRSRMAKYSHTPVRRAEAPITPEPDTSEQEEAA